jgi:hypothetical protein
MDVKTARSLRPSVKIEKKPLTNLADQLETRSREYLKHCSKTVPSEERHTVWSRLYAATHRLRNAVLTGGGDHAAVAEAVLEIGSNLLGCEEIAVFKLEADAKIVSILTSVGITAAHRQALNTHAAKLTAEINRGRVRIVDRRVLGDEFLASIGITALVPLSQGHASQGAIAFFNLLPQRKGYDSGDRELLGLLSIYVGPSLFGL